MVDNPNKAIRLELPLYALPHNADPEELAVQARDVAKALEEMGVFDQREFEPAHVFVFPEARSHE